MLFRVVLLSFCMLVLGTLVCYQALRLRSPVLCCMENMTNEDSDENAVHG